MRKFLVAGNWKMNGDSAANSELVGGVISGLSGIGGTADNVEVLVCPPFPYLAAVASQVAGSAVVDTVLEQKRVTGVQDEVTPVAGAEFAFEHRQRLLRPMALRHDPRQT